MDSQSKEFNVTLTEALEYLNNDLYHLQGTRKYYDTTNILYIDSVRLKRLVDEGKIDAYHSGTRYKFNINDLKNLKNEIRNIKNKHDTSVQNDYNKRLQEAKQNAKPFNILMTVLFIIFLLFIIIIFYSPIMHDSIVNGIDNSGLRYFGIYVIMFYLVLGSFSLYTLFSNPIGFKRVLSWYSLTYQQLDQALKRKETHDKDDFIKVKNDYVLKKDLKNFVPNDIKIDNSFQIIKTFRDFYSNSWEGKKDLFEYYLVQNSITYFTYIKFIYNKNNLQCYPFVIGVSASKLINKSGSDLSFDYNENGGPARQWLIRNKGYDWVKSYIAILPCNTRQDSLKFEKYYSNKYKLLES